LHLPYEEQLKLKQEMVTEAFAKHRIKVDVARIYGSPEEFRYRNRMNFAFANSDTGPIVGLHERGDPRDRSHQMTPVCEINDCWLGSDDANSILATVQDEFRGSKLRAYNPVTRAGVLRGLEVRSGVEGSAVSLSVANDKHVPVDKIVSRLERKTVGVSIRVGRSRSKHAAPRKLQTVSGRDRQTIAILGNSISLSGSVFSQVNVFQMERLYEIAMEMAKVESGHHVLDLYSGVGTLSIAIAQHAKKVFGIEIDATAVKNAQENASNNNRLNCFFRCSDASNSSQWGDPLHQFDIVTANPPRAGLAPKVIEGIAATRANRVTYISCNPETLARDCKRLCSHNYEVTEVKPVDMFPQTIHIETVVKLERRNRVGH